MEGTPQQDSAGWRQTAEIWARGRILLSRSFSHTIKNSFPHSSLFSFIFLTLFPFHAIIPPARRQKEMPLVFAARSARVGCSGEHSQKNHHHYTLLRQENQEGLALFRKIFDFLITTASSRGIVELYMRGCACRELPHPLFPLALHHIRKDVHT